MHCGLRYRWMVALASAGSSAEVMVDGEPEDHDVLVLAGDLLAAGWGVLSAAQGRLVLRSRAQAGGGGPADPLTG